MLTLNRCHSRRRESIHGNGRLRAHVQVVDPPLIPKIQSEQTMREHIPLPPHFARLKAIFVGCICASTWLISRPVDEPRMGIKYNEEIRVIRASVTTARVTKFPRTKLRESASTLDENQKPSLVKREAWIFMINIWILQTAAGNGGYRRAFYRS